MALALCCVSSCSNAQDANATTTTAMSSVTIGDPVMVCLEVRCGESLTACSNNTGCAQLIAEAAAAPPGTTPDLSGVPASVLAVAMPVLLCAEANCSSTTTAGPHTTPSEYCTAMALCLEDDSCSRCLAALNASNGVHTNVAWRMLSGAEGEYEKSFYRALVSTSACLASMGTLQPALEELGSSDACSAEFSMVVGACFLAEVSCFLNADCQSCLTTLTDRQTSGTLTGSALDSPACTAAGATAASSLASQKSFLDALTTSCWSFPGCSYAKRRCNSMSDCARCLATFSGDGGAKAATQQCALGPAADALDTVVTKCARTPSACDFWNQRCSMSADCSDCVAGWSQSNSVNAVAGSLSAASCLVSGLNQSIVPYMVGIMHDCDTMATSCLRAVSGCLISEEFVCISCLASNDGQTTSDTCAELISGYNISTSCSGT
jgi:hypothetical protein